jgi:serine/threonine-protein kinase
MYCINIMLNGARLGPFELDAAIGASAGSRVWRARDLRDGSACALKLAPLADAAACARLRNEFRLAGGITHPHLVRLTGAGTDPAAGMAWLAMECLPGTRAAVTPGTFRQLLLALCRLHADRVVHCDVKPANLLAARDGSLILADFGIARRAGQRAGPVHGTPHYMAPEQLRGRALDGRCDVFAAGVILFELATGQRPFDGTPFEVVSQILRGPAMPAGLAPTLEQVLRRALAADPGQRFADAAEFLAACDALGGAI